MFKYSEDKITKFDEYKPTEEEIKNELLIEDGRLSDIERVTKINNKWYYFKELHITSVLNELIGTYLAQYLNIDTVKYSIGCRNGTSNISVLSKNFKEKGYKYLYPYEVCEINPNMEYNFRNKVICDTTYLDKTNNILRTELLKLAMLDMYMGQFDRHCWNMMLKQQNDNITLAPIYDYENSFAFELMTYCYSNPFLTVSMNENGIEEFLLKYPFSYQTLYRLLELDIRDVLNEIGKIHNIEITNDAYKYYEKQESIKLLTKFK